MHRFDRLVLQKATGYCARLSANLTGRPPVMCLLICYVFMCEDARCADEKCLLYLALHWNPVQGGTFRVLDPYSAVIAAADRKFLVLWDAVMFFLHVRVHVALAK